MIYCLINQSLLLLKLDCPLPGHYGDNCFKECPENCWKGFCDSVKGTCLGCVPGYVGPNCNQGMLSMQATLFQAVVQIFIYLTRKFLLFFEKVVCFRQN